MDIALMIGLALFLGFIVFLLYIEIVRMKGKERTAAVFRNAEGIAAFAAFVIFVIFALGGSVTDEIFSGFSSFIFLVSGEHLGSDKTEFIGILALLGYCILIAVALQKAFTRKNTG